MEVDMGKGISLHAGLNEIDIHHYGTNGALKACEADAKDMYQIAKKHGYRSELLLSCDATRDAVIGSIKNAATELVAGDVFFISYAGHGAQIPDTNGDETDGRDETWCLYDGMLIDDELQQLWTTFNSGVRILVISDSCHSGTVTRAPTWMTPQDPNAPAERYLDDSISFRTFRTHRSFYDDIIKMINELLRKQKAAASVTPNVLLISGCQDNQTSLDGRHNGLFTGTLLSVWNEGQFQGDYSALHRRIVSRMPAKQTPNLYTLGTAATEFVTQRPFKI